MNLFLSLAGNTRVADNYCPRPACHWNNAPWRTSCSKCGALTERGRAELNAHDINEHYDHTPPEPCELPGATPGRHEDGTGVHAYERASGGVR